MNAYYQHAQNDPTMSQEDAITSTAEMSENYLMSNEGESVDDGIDGGEGADDGLDL